MLAGYAFRFAVLCDLQRSLLRVYYKLRVACSACKDPAFKTGNPQPELKRHHSVGLKNFSGHRGGHNSFSAFNQIGFINISSPDAGHTDF